MQNIGNQAHGIISLSRKRLWVFKKCLLSSLIISLLATAATRAEEPDSIYLRIYRIIDKGDVLSESGQLEAAKARYLEAHTNLVSFTRSYPSWNSKLVSYRLNYLAEKIAVLSQAPAAATAAKTDVASAVTSQATEAERTTATLTSVSEPQLKLLNPGSEPRQVLRLHPKEGDKQSLVMTMKTAMDMGMGQAMKIPAIKMTADVAVKDVSKDGIISYEMTLGDLSLADAPEDMAQMADLMKAALQGIKGLKVAGAVSDRGQPKEVEVESSPGENPQVRQTMDQMKEAMSGFASPLPEEAVGVGAKWEVKQLVKNRGMKITQTATYEVVSLNDGRLKTKMAMTQTAGSQKVENPAMLGAKVDLAKMSGNGNGTATWDLGRILPIVATSDSHTEINMNMNMGSKKQAMAMKMDLNFHLETK